MSKKKSKRLHVTLWVAQFVLGLTFILAGLMKLITPISELQNNLSWVNELPELLLVIGVAELLGGTGLLLPSLLNIYPRISAFAAIGLLIIMILAAGYHLIYKEYSSIPINLLFGSLSYFSSLGEDSKQYPCLLNTKNHLSCA